MIKTEFGIIDQTFCLGDGIEDCIVTRDGKIITSYFDEGVFGDAPFGNKGLVIWDSTGCHIWENKKYWMVIFRYIYFSILFIYVILKFQNNVIGGTEFPAH